MKEVSFTKEVLSISPDNIPRKIMEYATPGKGVCPECGLTDAAKVRFKSDRST